MSKIIYRVYDIYCTADSMLHSESKDKAEFFCNALNKKEGLGSYKVESIEMEVPHWESDSDCMPDN